MSTPLWQPAGTGVGSEARKLYQLEEIARSKDLRQRIQANRKSWHSGLCRKHKNKKWERLGSGVMSEWGELSVPCGFFHSFLCSSDNHRALRLREV